MMEHVKDIPGFKTILKVVLKSQIQLLVEQLAEHTDEESVILTASVADGTLSYLGSDFGALFLENNDDVKTQFLNFCLQKNQLNELTGDQQDDPSGILARRRLHRRASDTFLTWTSHLLFQDQAGEQVGNLTGVEAGKGDNCPGNEVGNRTGVKAGQADNCRGNEAGNHTGVEAGKRAGIETGKGDAAWGSGGRDQEIGFVESHKAERSERSVSMSLGERVIKQEPMENNTVTEEVQESSFTSDENNVKKTAAKRRSPGKRKGRKGRRSASKGKQTKKQMETVADDGDLNVNSEKATDKEMDRQTGAYKGVRVTKEGESEECDTDVYDETEVVQRTGKSTGYVEAIEKDSIENDECSKGNSDVALKDNGHMDRNKCEHSMSDKCKDKDTGTIGESRLSKDGDKVDESREDVNEIENQSVEMDFEEEDALLEQTTAKLQESASKSVKEIKHMVKEIQTKHLSPRKIGKRKTVGTKEKSEIEINESEKSNDNNMDVNITKHVNNYRKTIINSARTDFSEDEQVQNYHKAVEDERESRYEKLLQEVQAECNEIDSVRIEDHSVGCEDESHIDSGERVSVETQTALESEPVNNAQSVGMSKHEQDKNEQVKQAEISVQQHKQTELRKQIQRANSDRTSTNLETNTNKSSQPSGERANIVKSVNPNAIVIDLDAVDTTSQARIEKTPVKQVTGQSATPRLQRTPSASSAGKQSTPTSLQGRRSSQQGTPAKGGNFIDNLISKGIPIIIPDEDDESTPKSRGTSIKQKLYQDESHYQYEGLNPYVEPVNPAEEYVPMSTQVPSYPQHRFQSPKSSYPGQPRHQFTSSMSSNTSGASPRQALHQRLQGTVTPTKTQHGTVTPTKISASTVQRQMSPGRSSEEGSGNTIVQYAKLPVSPRTHSQEHMSDIQAMSGTPSKSDSTTSRRPGTVPSPLSNRLKGQVPDHAVRLSQSQKNKTAVDSSASAIIVDDEPPKLTREESRKGVKSPTETVVYLTEQQQLQMEQVRKQQMEKRLQEKAALMQRQKPVFSRQEGPMIVIQTASQELSMEPQKPSGQLLQQQQLAQQQQLSQQKAQLLQQQQHQQMLQQQQQLFHQQIQQQQQQQRMATSQLLTQAMMSNSVNMSNLNMVPVSSEGVNIPGMPVLFNVLQAMPISIAISQPSESLPVISGVTSMAAQFVDPPDLPDTRPQASVIQMHTNSYEQVYGTSNTGVLQSMAIKRTYAEEFGGNLVRDSEDEPLQKRATFLSPVPQPTSEQPETLSPSKQSPRVEIDVDLPSVKQEMMQEYETMALKSSTRKLKEAERTFYPPISPSTKRLHSHPGTRSRVAASSTSSEGSSSEPSSSSDVLAAGSKSFGCGDCGKTFATKQGLSIHFKKHTKETPFECDVCGKHYSKKACLTKHIMTHFNESTSAS